MKSTFFVALVAALVFQLSAAQDKTSINPRCRPPRFCFQSRYCSGILEPTFDSRGCPACPKCVLEPKCEPQICTMQYCENPIKTTLPNGCPGCDLCDVEPVCEPQMCTMQFCENAIQTTLPNGCPGCDICP